VEQPVALNQHFVKREFRKNLMSIVLAFPTPVRRGIRVVLGTGKRLFGDGTIPLTLKLIDSKVSKTGVTINTYERAGDTDIGSFEFDEPTEAEIEQRQRLAAG
jgi:hypothetical protein